VRWRLSHQCKPKRYHRPSWRSCGARISAHLRTTHVASASSRQCCTTFLPGQPKDSRKIRTNAEACKSEGYAAVLRTSTRYQLKMLARKTNHLGLTPATTMRQVRLRRLRTYMWLIWTAHRQLSSYSIETLPRDGLIAESSKRAMQRSIYTFQARCSSTE
jgi:hypothetical protein